MGLGLELGLGLGYQTQFAMDKFKQLSACVFFQRLAQETDKSLSLSWYDGIDFEFGRELDVPRYLLDFKYTVRTFLIKMMFGNYCAGSSNNQLRYL